MIAANADDASDTDLATARDEGEQCLALDPPADARAPGHAVPRQHLRLQHPALDQP